MYLKYHSVLVIRLPAQVIPSPVNPFLQVQLYEPAKFAHVPFVSQGLEKHSSMSEKIKHKFCVRLYISNKYRMHILFIANETLNAHAQIIYISNKFDI